MWALPYNPSINETVTIYVTIANNGNVAEKFNLTMSCTLENSEVYNATKEAMLNPENVITINFNWTPKQWGSYKITVYTNDLAKDSNPQDNMKSLMICVSALEIEGPHYTRFGAEYWIILFKTRPLRLISSYY